MTRAEFFMAFLIISLAIAAGVDGVTKQAATIEIAANHIQKACVAVWEGTSDHKIDRCIVRTMSALNPSNRLRDNELKRLLLASEKELEKCQGGRDGNKTSK